jgi:hypothetical protein
MPQGLKPGWMIVNGTAEAVTFPKTNSTGDL